MDNYKTNHGFSLLELTIIIVIISILAVAVIVSWPDSSIDLAASANQVANDIRYTQSLSMSLNKRYRINFGSTSYVIANENGVPIQHPASTSTTITLPNGVAMSATQSCIAFNGLGIPYSCTNTNTKLNNNTVILSSSGDSKQITITSETGHVSIN